ncbi:MAG TPA: HAMP domain-containing histidine kinase [Papillibacter sp.]|jgi:signal transduction histidine kinase|nr:HAMP domain-containing histidine kinase [Papillibacter sp.]
MKKSLYFKNYLVTTCIVFLAFLILTSMFFVWSYRLILRERQKAMSSTAEEVVRYASAMTNSYPVTSFELRISLASFAKMSGFDIMIADETGAIVSTSDMSLMSSELGRVVPFTALQAVESGQDFSWITDLGGVYQEARHVIGAAFRLASGRGPGSYVFVSADARDMIAIWRKFTGIFMLISLGVLFATFIITYYTTKKQARPLNEMARAARRFAHGDFSVRVKSEGRDDEIGQLTEAFNSMADSLERLETLRRDFIANVSHELKTPMTTISGFTDGILDGTIPPESQSRYLEVISSETKRLSRLVRTMLSMSRIQNTKPEELLRKSFDASETIRLALVGLSGRIEEKKLDVAVELPEEPVMTRGDMDAITQVTYNLADNAVKFAREGTTLRFCLWKQGQKAYISVENTGEEIPPEEIPLIFERFHKKDRSRSENRDGAGLGLYIVKAILNNHNEDITVTSAGGVTTFTFTLTLASQKAPE